MRKFVGKFVEIEWQDAASVCHWTTPQDPNLSTNPCISRGWVVKVTDKAVTLAGTYCLEQGRLHQISECITIPLAWAKVRMVDKKAANLKRYLTDD